jgi:hypothetical protein
MYRFYLRFEWQLGLLIRFSNHEGLGENKKCVFVQLPFMEFWISLESDASGFYIHNLIDRP